jgi:hypothetical protein
MFFSAPLLAQQIRTAKAPSLRCDPETGCGDTGDGGGGGGSTTTQTVSSHWKNEPSRGQTAVTLYGTSGNIAVVVDKATDRVYINAAGLAIDYSLPQLATMMYPSDATAQSAFLAKTRGDMGNSLYWSDGESDPATVNTATLQVKSIKRKKTRAATLMAGPGSGYGMGTCGYYSYYDYGCYFVVWDWGSLGVSSPDGYGGGGGYPASYIEIDEAIWQHEHDKACQHLSTSRGNYLLAIGGATAACYAAYKSPKSSTVSACGLGIGAVLTTRSELVDDNRLCFTETYPGPGNY